MSSGSEPGTPVEQPAAGQSSGAGRGRRSDAAGEPPGVMIPARRKRLPLETFVMRLVATAGVVGISVAIAAIMTSNHSKGWVIGLVVSLVSVILAAFLWSSRRL